MAAGIDNQYILFSLGDEEYAIPISIVEEIIKVENLIKVPRAKEYFSGIMDIRGKVVKMIDLAKKLNVNHSEDFVIDRAIVVKAFGESIGILVDKVAHVVEFSKDSINPPPPSIKGISSRYILGVGKKDDRFIIIIDIQKILSSEEVAELAKGGS